MLGVLAPHRTLECQFEELVRVYRAIANLITGSYSRAGGPLSWVKWSVLLGAHVEDQVESLLSALACPALAVAGT